MTEQPAKARRVRWHFAVVLAASLLLAVAEPLTSNLAGKGWFDLFFSLLIAAVMLLIFEEKEHRRTALSLGLGAFLGIWLSHGFGGLAGKVLLVGSYLLAAVFFTYALYGILRAILVPQASGGAVFGAICGYLLLGIIWGLLYTAVETAHPGSFVMPSPENPAVRTARVDRDTLTYYSFITLTTVGYGDVAPTTSLARTLAWMEAVTGQFYLAILVAGLVGYKVSQARND